MTVNLILRQETLLPYILKVGWFFCLHNCSFHFFEKAISKETLFGSSFQESYCFSPPIPVFCLHKEKKFLDTRPTHSIYTFGVNPASGSTQSWQVDRFIETRIVMIFISAVKNSILKKIYTFSIAFLELTISKKKLLFFF